ncbi:hypothetical protein [Streptomyces anandii]|uniref:hypothetical protein n=1 Tax=Streptomyces anandii TaxID=285454 RepID=UPI0027E47D6F|nr:hypothetical protein [Streptomyces anandii]
MQVSLRSGWSETRARAASSAADGPGDWPAIPAGRGEERQAGQRLDAQSGAGVPALAEQQRRAQQEPGEAGQVQGVPGGRAAHQAGGDRIGAGLLDHGGQPL